MASRTFTAMVQQPDDGPGHAVEVPFDPVEVFGRARAPVLVTVPGHDPFRTTIASYGGTGWIGLRKAQRDDLMVEAGDEITMTVEFDDVPQSRRGAARTRCGPGPEPRRCRSFRESVVQSQPGVRGLGRRGEAAGDA